MWHGYAVICDTVIRVTVIQSYVKQSYSHMWPSHIVICDTGMVENYHSYFPAWAWVCVMLDMEFSSPLIQNTSESQQIQNTSNSAWIQNANKSVLLSPACHPTIICCHLWASPWEASSLSSSRFFYTCMCREEKWGQIWYPRYPRVCK